MGDVVALSPPQQQQRQWREHLTDTEVVGHCLHTAQDATDAVARGVAEIVLRRVALCSQAAGLVGRSLAGSRVTTLVVSDCAFGERGVGQLGHALLDAACVLRHVDVSCNGVAVLPPPFLDAVARSRTLEGLNVGMNPLRRGSVAALCAAVAAGGTVRDLNVASTGALHCPKELSAAATASPRLRTLRVGCNSCWDADDARVFARALCRNFSAELCGLGSLDLSSSGVGLEECGLLAEVVATVTSLEHLCLRGNDVCANGVVALSAGLAAEGAQLRSLNLSGNTIAGVRVLPHAYSTCSYGEHAAAPAAAAIAPPRLQRERRTGTYTEKGLVALAAALAANRTLALLDVSGCHLGLGTNPFYDGTDHGGVALLCDTAKRAVSLRSLRVADNCFNAATEKRLRRVAGGKAEFAVAWPPTSLEPSPSTRIMKGV